MIDEFGGDLFQWLRGFYFVGRTGSVTRAEEAMRRNQPAISHQIKRLEEQFRVQLFDRSRGKMELTAEGKVLMSMVVPLFMLIEEMKEKVQKPILPVEETVYVAATHAVLSYYLPPFIKEFRRMYPRVSFELYGGTFEDILASIETGRADFAIAGIPEKPYSLVATDQFETTCKLVFSKKVAAFRMKRVALEEIARLPYISFPPTTFLSRFIEKLFFEKGLKLQPVLMINNIEIMKKYVELGMGVTILEDFAITAEDQKKFCVVDLGTLFEKRKYQLLMRQKHYLNPAARAFLELIRQGSHVQQGMEEKEGIH